MKSTNITIVYRRLSAIFLVFLLAGLLLKISHIGMYMGNICIGIAMFSLFIMLIMFVYQALFPGPAE